MNHLVTDPATKNPNQSQHLEIFHFDLNFNKRGKPFGIVFW
jgi:hypothetical protein